MFDKASLKLGLDKAVLQSMSMKENVGMVSNFLPFLELVPKLHFYLIYLDSSINYYVDFYLCNNN